MLSTVLRILKSCPKLVQVNIRWAREKCLNHLKQEGVYDVVEWEEDGKGMEEGRRPKTLMVFERGIPLIGKPFSRRYKYTLPGRSGGVGNRGFSLMGDGKGISMKLGRRKTVINNVMGGGDTDEGAVVSTSPVDVVDESVESVTEDDADTEVEAERDGDGDGEGEEITQGSTILSFELKGKEVKRIGLLTPTTT